jgi:hypothetical protein
MLRANGWERKKSALGASVSNRNIAENRTLFGRFGNVYRTLAGPEDIFDGGIVSLAGA